jgi:WD40 repeat protein
MDLEDIRVGSGARQFAMTTSPLAQATSIKVAANATSPQIFTAVCNTPVGVISVAERTPLCWSEDGTMLAAVGGNGSIFILHLVDDTFKMWKLLLGHKHTVRCLLFHPKNSNQLVSGGVDGLFVWDVGNAAITQLFSYKTAKELGVPASLLTATGAHESDVESMAWAFDGASLVTGSKDASLKAWDTAKTGQWRLLETISGHKAPVLNVKFCPATARLASAGRDASIKIWDASTLALEWRVKRADDGGIACNLVGTCEGHGDIVALTWAKDGSQLLSGSRDNSLRLWDVATFSEIRDVFDKKLGLQGKHRSDVCRVAFVPGDTKHVFSCSLDGTVKLWRLQSGDKVLAAEHVSGTAQGAGTAVATTDTAVVESTDIASSEWDESTKALLSEILGLSTVTTAKVIKASGVDACLASQQFFQAEEGICELEVNPTRPIVAIASSSHSFALLALRLDTVPWLERMYDGTLPPGSLPPGTSLDPLVEVQAFHGHTASINSVVMLPDDRTVFSASNDYTAARFDVATVERLASYSTGASVHGMALGSPTAGGPSFLFVGSGDYIIRAYSTSPADYEAVKRAYASMPVSQPLEPHEFEAARYVGHSGCVLAISVDSQNRYMVSGGRDWSVLLWDIAKVPPTVSVRISTAVNALAVILHL